MATQAKNFPTQVNPNTKQHWSGLSKAERTQVYLGRGTYLPGSESPLPKYVASRRSVDGKVQKTLTHTQRYKALRAAFNVT